MLQPLLISPSKQRRLLLGTVQELKLQLLVCRPSCHMAEKPSGGAGAGGGRDKGGQSRAQPQLQGQIKRMAGDKARRDHHAC